MNVGMLISSPCVAVFSSIKWGLYLIGCVWGYAVMYVKACTVSGRKYCAQWQSLSLPWLFIIIVSHLQPSVMIACCFYCQVHIPVWSATWVTTAAQGRLSGQPGGEIRNSWCLSVPSVLLHRNGFQLYCWDRSPLGCTKALVGEPLLSFLLRLLLARCPECWFASLVPFLFVWWV